MTRDYVRQCLQSAKTEARLALRVGDLPLGAGSQGDL